MAANEEKKQQTQKDEAKTADYQAQSEKLRAEETRAETAHSQNFVEAQDDDGNKVRAIATPEDEQAPPTLDNLPEPDATGYLEHYLNPDPVAEAEKQERENYPRVPEEAFDPAAHEVEEARFGQAATHRSVFGRVVIVEEDCIHDGEVYKAGVQDLPIDVADALISSGDAFEPAGKKRGR